MRLSTGFLPSSLSPPQYDSLEYLAGQKAIKSWRAMVPAEGGGAPQPSTNSRFFCGGCGSALWCHDPAWSRWFYPHASAVDTPLPKPPHSVHICLASKAPWVASKAAVGPGDQCFDEYPEQSIEAWHRAHGLWVAGEAGRAARSSK